jgi:hypothetical protein
VASLQPAAIRALGEALLEFGGLGTWNSGSPPTRRNKDRAMPHWTEGSEADPLLSRRLYRRAAGVREPRYSPHTNTVVESGPALVERVATTQLMP